MTFAYDEAHPENGSFCWDSYVMGNYICCGSFDMNNYKNFRKAICYLFTPGASANFHGLIREDGLRRDAVTVDYVKTDGDIGEYRVRINYRVLKDLDEKEEE